MSGVIDDNNPPVMPIYASGNPTISVPSVQDMQDGAIPLTQIESNINNYFTQLLSLLGKQYQQGFANFSVHVGYKTNSIVRQASSGLIYIALLDIAASAVQPDSNTAWKELKLSAFITSAIMHAMSLTASGVSGEGVFSFNNANGQDVAQLVVSDNTTFTDPTFSIRDATRPFFRIKKMTTAEEGLASINVDASGGFVSFRNPVVTGNQTITEQSLTTKAYNDARYASSTASMTATVLRDVPIGNVAYTHGSAFALNQSALNFKLISILFTPGQGALYRSMSSFVFDPSSLIISNTDDPPPYATTITTHMPNESTPNIVVNYSSYIWLYNLTNLYTYKMFNAASYQYINIFKVIGYR